MPQEGGWSYAGTKLFIRNQPMKAGQRKLLLKLIEVLEKHRPDITMKEFQGFFTESD